MFRQARLVWGLLPVLICQLGARVGRAQTPENKPLSPAEARRIELLVRSELGVPSDWEMAPEPRSPSLMPGFDTLFIDFFPPTNPEHKKKTVEFLLSRDGKTLAQMTKYDVTNIPGTTISVAGRPVRGEEGAPVEIVSFDDLECPYCAMMHSTLFPQTLEHYKGLIKVIYKDDPLTEIHPWAMHAAVDAHCLATQSAVTYWGYIDYLHDHYRDITVQPYDAVKANALLDILARNEGARSGLDGKALDACLLRQDETAVHDSMKEAAQLRVEGTPALFVDGERLSGAQSQTLVWAAIDRALRARSIRPPDRPAPTALNSSAVASNTPK